MAFPPLNIPLSEMDHPLLKKAQRIPNEVVAGGAERIQSLTDRVWWKCKVTSFRGAVTELSPADVGDPSLLQETGAWWWIAAAGGRQEDSASDFYKAIEAEVIRARKKVGKGGGTETVSTEHLLPTAEDYKRLRVEAALQTTLAIHRVVREVIWRSLKDGNTWSASVTGHVIKACVRAQDQEAYLAISAEGFLDSKIIAVILASVPDLTVDDWMVEPGGAMGTTPGHGQIVYSAVIPAATQAAILDEFSSEE